MKRQEEGTAAPEGVVGCGGFCQKNLIKVDVNGSGSFFLGWRGREVGPSQGTKALVS